MKLYHVLVEREDKWYVGRVLEREGVTTQGRSLDELVFMLRDAIEMMWNEKKVELELIIPSTAQTSFEQRQRLASGSRSVARARKKRALGKVA